MVLFKKLWRTIGKYKAQFISMIIMIALGIGVFLGFNIEWYSIERGAKNYFTSSNIADYKVYSSFGFSDMELEQIKQIDGINDATRWLNVKVSVPSKNANLSLNSVENYGISTFSLISGVDYNKDDENGIWLSDQFAKENNLKLNDIISLKYAGKNADLKIIGLIKSSEYMVCIDENQLMPKFKDYGFCFVSPNVALNTLEIKNTAGEAIFNQIYLKSNLNKTDLENKVNQTLGKTMMILSLDENTSYQSVKSEAEEGKTIGSIIPVLFLVIAMLTMITTMNRVTKNEKTQIGTLKAIGFKDSKILFHYTSFGLMIGIIGSILGVVLGFGVARLILSPSGMMSTYFDWEKWVLYMPWFCPVVIVGTIIVLTLVSFFTVRKYLITTPAETLRPYQPKHIKQTKLEKTKIWNKCSFGFKWNYRDTIRNKSRSIVTLIGVIGCVILIVASLGMANTMGGFMSTLNNSMNYSTKINIAETANLEDIENLKTKYSAEGIMQTTIKFDGKAIGLQIYPQNIQSVKFYNSSGEQINLTSDGVYICERIAQNGVKVGDTITFSPFGTDLTITANVAGVNKSLISETLTMTTEYAQTLGLGFKATALLTNVNSKLIETNNSIASVQDKDNLMSSYEYFMQIMNMSITILMIAAVVLALVVLYNLGVMSYTERYRELATLKVVGFKDKQISKLLIGQNTLLTTIGTVFGLPLGYGVLYWMIKALASEYELKVHINFSTYLIAIALTVGVSLLVGWMIARKNKKINMAEALKDKE